MNIFNNRGCFGGGGSAPDPVVVPAPAPSPTPISPSEVEGQVTAQDRRRKLARMRSGLSSTIKTGAKGLTGSGSDLISQMLSGKDKLGS